MEGEKEFSSTDALLWVDPNDDARFRLIGRRLDRESRGYYFHMFLDDASKICGYRQTGTKYHLESSRISDRQAMAAIGGDETPYSLDYALDDFFEAIMHDQIMYGVSYWAAVTDTRYEGRRSDAIETPFRIYRLPGWTIRRLGRTYRQVVPREYATSRFRKNSRRLDRSQIMAIRLRGSHGRQLRRFMRFVRSADRWHARDHKMTMAELSGGFTYSRESRGKLFAAHFLRRSRDVGWSARQLHNDGMIEPTYTAYRNLIFQEFLAGCREQLLKEVNSHFERLGSQLNFRLRITAPGLTSPHGIRKLRDGLYSGDDAIVDLMTMTAEKCLDRPHVRDTDTDS